MNNYKPVQRFNTNKKGIDYIVGDIHGAYSKLEQKLEEVGFNPSVDRLFCTGDLADRGSESTRSLEYLNKKWFKSVLGNHEQMLIDTYDDNDDGWVLRSNGGMWYFMLTKDEQRKFADTYRYLPLVIELNTDNGKICILHSEFCGNDYKVFKEEVLKDYHSFKTTIIWSRNTTTNVIERPSGIKNVLAVVAGHTPVDEGVVVDKNYYFIDTGGCFNDGKFTLLNTKTMEFV